MSPWHWAVVIAVAVLLFGARRLPDAARSLGRSARILRAELNDEPAGAASPDAGPTPSGTGSDHPAEHPRRAEGPADT